MKIRNALFAMTALALVPGCSGGTQNSSATANAPATTDGPAGNVAEPGTAPANTAEAAGTIDRAFLVGRWGVDGDCSQVMEFAEDGTASPPPGSRWTMAGDQVTVTNPGGAPDTKTVARTGDDAMTVSGEGGSSISMTRCPAA